MVKNYEELVHALSDQNVTRVMISAKYKHSVNEHRYIALSGRTVLIVPENGESAVINGRVDITGSGTVNFENVSIEGPAGDVGLCIKSGASVTIGSVTGGKAKKENGYAAVIVEDATLTIDSAVGSDGKGGFGGDGIYAFGNSTVQVREAVGGSAPKGFGGSGVVAFGGAKVTVTGSATGGNGLYTPGKGVLVGLNGAVDGEGTLTDGTELEGKKSLDLEAVANRNMLENALRCGKIDILLTSGYKTNSKFPNEMRLFCAGADPIRIASADEKKPATMDGRLYVSMGTWTFENIKFTISTNDKYLQDACLWITDDANVTASGSVTAKNTSIGIYAEDNAKVEFIGDCVSAANGVFSRGGAAIVFNGNVTVKSKQFFAVGARNYSSIILNGNVDVTGDTNALYIDGSSRLTMTGSVHIKGTTSIPAVYANGGEMTVTGPITNDGKSACIECVGGNITVNGDITAKTTEYYPVYMDNNAGEITINGTLFTVIPAYNILHGNLTINGNIIIRTKQTWDSWGVTTPPGTVTVTGETKIEK